MKKQILFLAFFTLALIFAGTNKSYGQNAEEDYLTAAPTYCVPAAPLNCGAGDALTPLPGVSYNYEISSSSVGTIHWFVTDDPSILATGSLTGNSVDPGNGTGDYILISDAVYNASGNTLLSIDLTWKSFDGNANQVLLVAYNMDADGCTNNIEVYRIVPKYSFTLDIAGILDDGTEGADECVSPIVSASYDGTNLNIDYGMNYVFFTVNAANWQTSWQTNLVATNPGGGSTVGAPEWAYPANATTGGAWNASGTAVLASQYTSNDNGFIGSAGECIIVRVPVTHGTATENIANETINLVVNGEMLNPETTAYDGVFPDLDNAATAGDPCVTNYNDNADYVITPRPDINEVDPTPFENKVPRD